MNTNEKWNLLVSHVHQKLIAKENEIQRLWEEIFADADFFGYSKFNGEVDAQRKMHIGSYDRTIPDMIIHDSIKHRDLFAVELKQHNMIFDNRYKEQLFSYLRLLRLNVGVLICDKIYLYYLDYDDSEMVTEIAFTEDNVNGSKLFELLSKNSFDAQKVKDFINTQYEFDQHVKEITQDIPKLDLKSLVVKYYSQKYTQEEIDQALANITLKFEDTSKHFGFDGQQRPPKSINPDTTTTISKNKAIKLFRNCGFQLDKNITFASKNKSANNYWANPAITCLNKEFWLILNDNLDNKLYLFHIPANAIRKSQLVTRSDKPNAINLQIAYHDTSFTDKISGYSFASFLLKEIDY